MRIHFQERPWDIYSCIVYAALESGLVLVSNTGNSTGVPLIFFAPGYVLVAALFPGNNEIRWIERIVLSVGVSIVAVPLLGFLLDLSPWGMGFDPVVMSVAGFTILTGLTAYSRRIRLPVTARLGLTVEIAGPQWRRLTLFDKALTIGLVGAILASATALAVIGLSSAPGSQATEFYILGPGGNATGYPTRLNASQQAMVIVAVANQETSETGYTLRVDLVGMHFEHNVTTGANETVEVNRTTWSWFNVSLARRETWFQRYAFSIPAVGLWKIQFMLFRDGNISSIYREVHLFVQVS